MNERIRIYAVQTGYLPANQRESGRKLLAFALADTFGTDINELNIQKTPSGKPYAAGRRDIHFNLSHTPGFAVCAVGEVELGVDVERERKAVEVYDSARSSDTNIKETNAPPFRPISKRVIDRFLDGCPPEQAVLRWTQRESYGKMTGEGFFFALPKRPHIYRSYYELPGAVVTLCVGSGAGGLVVPYSQLPEKITWYKENESGKR